MIDCSVLLWNAVKVLAMIGGSFLLLCLMIWLHGDPPDRR